MPLTLAESNVEINPTFTPMLTDLQANIIKGHGRDFGYHIFVKFNQAKIPAAKAWIIDFATQRVTSCMKQLQERDAHRASGTDGGAVFTLSLSATGYNHLGIATLPTEVSPSPIPATPVFQQGLKASAATLGDDPSKWEPHFKDDIDMLILVADDVAEKAKFLANEIVTQLSAFSTVLLKQKGHSLHRTAFNGEQPSDKINIEHFGYADGVSQPLYLADENVAQSGNKVWLDQEPLNLVLVKDPNGKTVDSYGSFLVFRKLEQNVKAFCDAEDGLKKIKDTDGFANKDLGGAMIVGRFENGNPVVLSNGVTGSNTKQSQITNDFDYSTDPQPISNGSKCPFFGHTRITNPRKDVGFSHSVRLTRRGMPFDDVKRFGVEDVVAPTEEQLDKHKPTHGVGLLFMCYQAHINAQFEFIQSAWVNQGNLGGHSVAQDGIIGQGPKPATKQELPDQWGSPAATHQINFGGFVTMKGGEYFFTPSISALKNL